MTSVYVAMLVANYGYTVYIMWLIKTEFLYTHAAEQLVTLGANMHLRPL